MPTSDNNLQAKGKLLMVLIYAQFRMRSMKHVMEYSNKENRVR